MANILIIEDNVINMKLASVLLLNAGHIVQCAVNAEAGIFIAIAEIPDLIMIDIQLPGMDGLTATAILKNNSATANIPIIAVTALAMKADQEKSRLAGCNAYIAKPLRYKELYAVIDGLLGKTVSPAPKDTHFFFNTSS